jgi:hypothetical protein
VFTTNLEEVLEAAEIIFLALPTPPGANGSADLKYVLGVADQMGKLMKGYKVVVNKSTVPVGTADKVREAIAKNYKGEFLPGFKAWKSDYNPTAVGLKFIDHMVGNVGWNQMNATVKWYEDVMGFVNFLTFDDKQITTEALSQITANHETQKFTTVVYQENWHKGVIGIVASRLMERYFKPTIVLTASNGMVTGSARTVNDFDIHGAIHHCGELLHQFGGHRHAAGLTMHPQNLNSFIESFEKVVVESIHPDDQSPEIKIDLEIQFQDLYSRGEAVNKIPRVKRNLLRFEPHGPGNMQPVFLSKNIYAADFRVLKEKHLKLKLVDPLSEIYLDAIAFNLADKIDDIAAGLPFDIVFTLEINKWRDRETIQLNVRDIRSSV